MSRTLVDYKYKFSFVTYKNEKIWYNHKLKYDISIMLFLKNTRTLLLIYTEQEIRVV